MLRRGCRGIQENINLNPSARHVAPKTFVRKKMSSIMEELLANSSFADLKQGSIIKGKIIEIRQNEVVVDIGGKSDGVVPVNDFADINDLQIGEEIEVLLEKL